jgi:phospholipase C
MRPRIRSLLLLSFAAGVAVTGTAIGMSSCKLTKGDKGATGQNLTVFNSDVYTASGKPFDITKINHVVVIYQENWSFDALYSQFPNATGHAFGAVTQKDINGGTLATMPPPLNSAGTAIDTTTFPSVPGAGVSTAFVNLLSAPYSITTSTLTGDIIHQFYTEQGQIDGGANDKFIAWSDNPGLVLTGYDATNLPEGKLAQQYVMCDNCFHSAFGGSFLNHIFFIAAAPPLYGTSNAAQPNTILKGYPAAMASSIPATLPTPSYSAGLTTTAADATGPIPTTGTDWYTVLTGSANNRKSPDGKLTSTPDGSGNYFAVNTMQPPYWPFSLGGPFLPPQTMPTIGDRLTTAGVSWKWYSGGWNQAVAGNPDANFQFHHQPFNYFANFAPGKPGRVHLADVEDLEDDIATGTLPAVSFVKMIGSNNEHPGYADLLTGQQAVADLVQKIQNSANWKDTAIIITYDEHGGRWDHVAPPTIDSWGPGVRVPMIIISPYAKRSFVDHTQYETVSILRFIEKRWSLTPLATRDAAAHDLSNAFTDYLFSNG